MLKRSKFNKTASISDMSSSPHGPFASSDASSVAEFNLVNHFLIAMPSMLDPIFGGTVVYLCEHHAGGALGVIINKPTDMNMGMLFERIALDTEDEPQLAQLTESPVMFGGPVQVERGFVLHAPDAQYSSMIRVSDQIALTTSKDVLEAVALGEGPERFLVTLGCAGWSAGQLEEEILRNGWLTVSADPDIIFDLPAEQRFGAAFALLGVEPVKLSSQAGHA